MGEFFFRAIPDAKSCAHLFVIPVPGESGGDSWGWRFCLCGFDAIWGGGLGVIARSRGGAGCYRAGGGCGGSGQPAPGGDVAWVGDALQGADTIHIFCTCYRITALWQGVLSDDLHHVIASQAADIA